MFQLLGGWHSQNLNQGGGRLYKWSIMTNIMVDSCYICWLLHLSQYQRHWLPQIHRRPQLKSSHYKPSQLLARSARLIFRNYSIITPPSSPKPINPLALLPLLGSPLKSSVLSLPAAVWNAPTSHHTPFSTLNCFSLLPTATIHL